MHLAKCDIYIMNIVQENFKIIKVIRDSYF
jgi:hypothetical protein